MSVTGKPGHMDSSKKSILWYHWEECIGYYMQTSQHITWHRIDIKKYQNSSSNCWNGSWTPWDWLLPYWQNAQPLTLHTFFPPARHFLRSSEGKAQHLVAMVTTVYWKARESKITARCTGCGALKERQRRDQVRELGKRGRASERAQLSERHCYGNSLDRTDEERKLCRIIVPVCKYLHKFQLFTYK